MRAHIPSSREISKAFSGKQRDVILNIVEAVEELKEKLEELEGR